MKAALLLVLALTACEKTNDIAALREEATTVAKFYQPKVDELSHRIEMIFQHGKTLPAGLLGIKDTSAVLEKARTKIIEMRKAVMPGPDGKSSIEAQADTAAKAGDAVELEKLVDDSQETLEADANETDDALSTVEAWLGQAEIVAANAPAAKPTPTP